MKDEKYAEYLDDLADKHTERLIIALQSLEDRIAAYLIDAPEAAGELFDLEWAINARSELRSIIREEFLGDVRSLIREYPEVEGELLAMLNQYGSFTKLPAETITALQRLSFQGFEAIATTHLDTFAQEIYQYTLTGRSKADMVKRIRQSINGVYAQADQAKIKQLVEVANFGSEAASKRAIEELHKVYAADKLGNNMRRYATVYAQDSIMQFNAQAVVAHGKQAGVKKWRYYGDVIRDSRPFCAEHAGKTFTTDEIYALWESDWKGKAAGDPFIVRGGYNCRHHFRPVI